MEVGDAEAALGVLAGEAEAHPLAWGSLGFEFAGAVLAAGAADEFFGVVDDDIVAVALDGEVAVDDFWRQELFGDGAALQLLEDRAGFLIDHSFVVFFAQA